MVIRPLSLLALLASGALLAGAQSLPTASSRADLQVGVGFVSANSDYDPDRISGGAVYATLDLTGHFGAEFVSHQADAPGSVDTIYERTFEAGPRYYRTCGPVKPYVKVLYGHGIFNYPLNLANLGYSLIAGGAGADFRLRPWLNLRIDYEYQGWFRFDPEALNPQLLTIGIAYHFNGGLQTARHR